VKFAMFSPLRQICSDRDPVELPDDHRLILASASTTAS
jgi:hypothetical protein